MDIDVRILDERLGCKFDLPSYATQGSAGLDLRAMSEDNFTIEPNHSILVPTGLSIYIKDPKFVGIITPRSGLGHKKGLVLGNLTGVIDADYQGPLMVSLWNRSNEAIDIRVGDRIAQLLIIRVEQVKLNIVDNFDDNTTRGEGGFGHTKVN